MKETNVFLIGPMGAGKTTLGKQLARVLSKRFIDSDHEIELRTGATIPWIFDIEGEEGFRNRETAVIDELTQQSGIILATGGGAVLRPENRVNLRNRGAVVYLFASIDELYARAGKDKNRPLLQTEDPKARLTKLFAERDPLYREVADLVVDTASQPLNTLIEDLVLMLHKLRKFQPGDSLS